MPGVQGAFDHFALDAKGKRLFLAASGHNTIEVLDLAQGKKTASITNLNQPAGVLYLPKPNQIAVASRGDGTCKLLDAATFKVINTVNGVDDADNLRIDPNDNRIFLGYGSGGLTGIDAANWKRFFDLKLHGHPEGFQLELETSLVFVNLPQASQVAVVNRKTRFVEALWPLKRAKANYPMALDEKNHRLFVGCREPGRMVVFDTTNGQALMDLALSNGADDMAYDAAHKSVYVSCSEGFIDIIQQRSKDVYLRRNRVPTRAGARTMHFSPEFNELYVAVPATDSQPAEVRVYQVK